MVIQGQTGWVVPPGNVEELARALAAVAGDPTTAHSMGALGQQRLVESFSRERMVREMAELLGIS
jgi:glycosyltransferase involved in cell wall biosynthesis